MSRSTLTGISCISATRLHRVRFRARLRLTTVIGAGPFAEKWTGGVRMDACCRVPDPRAIDFEPDGGRNCGAYGLSSVSCASAVRCMAVGGEGLTLAMQAPGFLALRRRVERPALDDPADEPRRRAVRSVLRARFELHD